MIWALVGAAISWLIGRGVVSGRQSPWVPSIVIAALSVAVGYAVLGYVDYRYHTDFRAWIIAVKLPNVQQLMIAAIYVVPITIGLMASIKTLVERLAVRGDGWMRQYGWAKLAMVLGFVVMLGLDYGVFFATGQLPTAIDPLSTVIAIQFLVLLPTIAVIAIFVWRRTGSYRPAALIAGMLVTLYVTAGTATQGW